MRKLHKGLIWFAVLALVSSSPAWAGSAYSTTTTTGSVLGNGPFTLGSAFTVGATDISVDKLGVFQSADTGVLLEAHDVGIWDAGGKLIAKATVAAGAADPLV